jgi:hypothetical protein
MNDEPKVLPDTMSKVGDYGAATSTKAIIQLLETHSCDHFKAFGTRGFEFPSSVEMPAPSKIVDAITKIILRKFWAESSREHVRKKAADRLTKVLTLNPSFSSISFIDPNYHILDAFPFSSGSSRCGRDSGPYGP